MIRQQSLYVIVGHAYVNGMRFERMRSKQSESSIYIYIYTLNYLSHNNHLALVN